MTRLLKNILTCLLFRHYWLTDTCGACDSTGIDKQMDGKPDL